MGASAIFQFMGRTGLTRGVSAAGALALKAIREGIEARAQAVDGSSARTDLN
ncbi:hypothetical protein WBP06_18800 [Novosphingobium sp. BL-8H]|uniref:hypothetical protein n=1 Tax=Novosphingobium sp. BL-8H TaxID=3127640 RepID=UPI0037582296